MKALARGAAALRSALGRPGSIRSKILTGFALILAGMLLDALRPQEGKGRPTPQVSS